MFIGIIQSCVPVVAVQKRPGLLTFEIELPLELSTGLAPGASIAIDGVCLTATTIAGNRITFDAMEETLLKTTIGQLKEGDRVNVERSARFGDEIGGHVLSGHVSGVADMIEVRETENNHVVTFSVPSPFMKYIFSKGFIALDGASLTVVDTDKKNGTFTVAFIPETLRRTTFGWKKKGDRVNVEIDSRTQAIVDTVEAMLPTLYHVS